jgi:hypothetical protein
LFAYGIFEVIYSPFKAFKEVIQTPKYIGPILIMLLFIGANAGSVYVVLSKTYVEQTLPKASRLDEWTENRTLWKPMPAANYNDYINGSYYGNRSLEFHVYDDAVLQMQLNSTKPINCSGIEGYKKISFRVKLIHKNITELENAILFLYSSPTDYFYHNFSEHLISLNTSVWDNLTIPIGPESIGWPNNNTYPDWDNITKIGFQFRWSRNTNATVRLDGLFFRGLFKSELENASSHILNFSLSALMQFTIKWSILSGILYILSKALGSETAWKPLLIVVGFTLIPLVIQGAINAGVYLTLPRLSYPLEYFSGIKAEMGVAHNKILEQSLLVYQISNYVQIGISVWIIALCAIAFRFLTEFSWTKTILVSTLAYFVSMLAEILLIGY